jgi:hypothetical protein
MVHEVGGHESSVGKDEEYIKTLVGTLKKICEHLRQRFLNDRVILKRSFRKCAGRIRWFYLGTTEGDEFYFKRVFTMRW